MKTRRYYVHGTLGPTTETVIATSPIAAVHAAIRQSVLYHVSDVTEIDKVDGWVVFRLTHPNDNHADVAVMRVPDYD